MIRQMEWTARTFALGRAPGELPGILERLRGTPARAAELLASAPEEVIAQRVDGGWSAKEHVGHLDDLHALDERRLEEFRTRAPVLTAADMENRATHAAYHNATPTAGLLARFRAHREDLVGRLEALEEGDLSITVLHPRLQKPLTVVDWVSFVAEHDDHHLARAREAIRILQAR